MAMIARHLSRFPKKYQGTYIVGLKTVAKSYWEIDARHERKARREQYQYLVKEDFILSTEKYISAGAQKRFIEHDEKQNNVVVITPKHGPNPVAYEAIAAAEIAKRTPINKLFHLIKAFPETDVHKNITVHLLHYLAHTFGKDSDFFKPSDAHSYNTPFDLPRMGDAKPDAKRSMEELDRLTGKKKKQQQQQQQTQTPAPTKKRLKVKLPKRSATRKKKTISKEHEQILEDTNYEVEQDEILPDQFPKLIMLAKLRQNILLVGPSGAGKSYISRKLAEKLNLPYGEQSCTAGMSESHLMGYLLPIKEGGTFAYVPSIFVNLYENGGIFLFDEMDAADSNTLIIINSALAADSFYVPQRHKNPEVKKHKDFIAIGAANTLGHGEDMVYAGRNQLDGATLDRFRAGIIEFDYSATVEEKLVDPQVLAWGRKIREKIKTHKLDRILSTRVMRDFTNQAQRYNLGEKEWNESYFADWTEDEIKKIYPYGLNHIPPQEINNKKRKLCPAQTSHNSGPVYCNQNPRCASNFCKVGHMQSILGKPLGSDAQNVCPGTSQTCVYSCEGPHKCKNLHLMSTSI